MSRFLLPLVAFAALVAVLIVGLRHAPEKNLIASPLIGRSAPVFNLNSLFDQHQLVTAAELKGHWTLVNVWGTWCVECRAEHEALLQIKREGRVPIIGIDWKDSDDDAQAWLSQLGNPYERVGTDHDGRAAIEWGVYGAPESFLVNPTGTVVYKQIGAMTPQVWQQKFLPLMQAAAGMNARSWLPAVCLVAGLLTGPIARAVDNIPPLADPALRERYYTLTHELRCMQCQNESLADSQVGLAADLREQVRELLLAGQSDEQIRDHMAARYGDFILFRPRMNWRNAWLWGAPLIMMLCGAFIAWRVLRDRAAHVDDDSSDPNAESPNS